jgi:serine/threonine protein kinase
VLLTDDYRAKLTNIGLKHLLQDPAAQSTRQPVHGAFQRSDSYRTPTKAADMYAFGSMLQQLISGQMQSTAAAIDDRCISWPSTVSELVVRCHNPDPDMRPTAEEVLDIIAKACQAESAIQSKIIPSP